MLTTRLAVTDRGGVVVVDVLDRAALDALEGTSSTTTWVGYSRGERRQLGVELVGRTYVVGRLGVPVSLARCSGRRAALPQVDDRIAFAIDGVSSVAPRSPATAASITCSRLTGHPWDPWSRKTGRGHHRLPGRTERRGVHRRTRDHGPRMDRPVDLSNRLVELLEHAVRASEPEVALHALSALRRELDAFERVQAWRALDAGSSYGSVARALGHLPPGRAPPLPRARGRDRAARRRLRPRAPAGRARGPRRGPARE